MMNIPNPFDDFLGFEVNVGDCNRSFPEHCSTILMM